METVEKKNNKRFDQRLEKRRQKWLKEKQPASRITRARVAQQNNSSTSSVNSTTNKTSSKQDTKAALDSKGTKNGNTKIKTVHKQNNTTKSKTKEPDNNSSVSAKTPTKVPPPKSKYNNVKPAEKNNNTALNGIAETPEKSKSKKSKYQYVDPVEKLVSSTSVHIPKRFVLLVRNLPMDVTRDQVDEHFRKTGGVKSIRIPRDRNTDKPKGYAYVEFNSTISHRIALRLHNTTLAGKKITVEFTPNDKKIDKKDDQFSIDADELSKLNMPFDT